MQNQYKLWTSVAVIVLVIGVSAFLLGRQFGYSGDASQSARQLVVYPSASVEIAELRAQLAEMQRSEERILNVVLASFGAGVGLLTLINFGVIVISNYNLTNERSRLLDEAREVVNRSTDDLKQEVATLQSSANELGANLDTMRGDIENALKPLRLSESIRLAHNAVLGPNPDFMEAAVNWSRVAKLQAEMDQKMATAGVVLDLIGALQRIPVEIEVHETVLDEMEQALGFVKKAEPKDAFLVAPINDALDEIRKIRDRQ
jgi:cell division protein FtsB